MNPYAGRAPGAGSRFGFGWGPAPEAYGYGEPPYAFFGPPGRGFGRGFGMGRGGGWRRGWGPHPFGW
jgi:hypothetical protein